MMTTMTTMTRTYTELKRLKTFNERFEYLKLGGSVGRITFGFDRYLNQLFYRSEEWKLIRDEIIIRDLGCDLGIEGYDIFGGVRVHHMNPLVVEDLRKKSLHLIDPEFLICTSLDTHNALHYGGEPKRLPVLVERKPWDTSPWRQLK